MFTISPHLQTRKSRLRGELNCPRSQNWSWVIPSSFVHSQISHHGRDRHRLLGDFNISFKYLSVGTLPLNRRHGARSQGDCGPETDKSMVASATRRERRRTRPLPDYFLP